jgi:6-pyruvoyltetrahydropterin/6-carboxytetrahydropterin synthase
MRCRLERDYQFEAAHHLPRVPEGHKCKRLHGHSYRVTVVVEGAIDPELGWVRDFAAVDEVVSPLITRLDHQVLNDIPGLDNPTSELLAVWLWERLAPGLSGLTEVAISETGSSRCVFRGA